MGAGQPGVCVSPAPPGPPLAPPYPFCGVSCATHAPAGSGYAAGMVPEHLAPAARLLARQHDSLHEELTRLELLEGAAHADVFLLVRRRLAVHLALERLVVPGAGSALVVAVVRAEDVGPEGAAGREATARILRAHRAHLAQETQHLTRPGVVFADVHPAVVALAEELWHGGGETYLGTNLTTMLEHAAAELSRAVIPGRCMSQTGCGTGET